MTVIKKRCIFAPQKQCMEYLMELIDFINSIGPLPESSKKMLLTAFRQVRFPKGHCLMREHGRTRRAFLIKEGIAHAYAWQNGKSVTFWIGKEGNVISPGPSLHDSGSEYGTVELLEDGVLYEIDLCRLHHLYLEDVHLANWGRILAEKECISMEKAILLRRFKTTLQLYEELLAECPEIVGRVPVHVIASYLNTSSENLSRIRRKIR